MMGEALLTQRSLQACRDFLALAETHSRKWQRALQYEQEQRVHLEETIEQLAKQHNSLERAFRYSLPSRTSDPSKGECVGTPPPRAHTELALASSGQPLPGCVSHASHHLAAASLCLGSNSQ